jgi:hypothetical protein
MTAKNQTLSITGAVDIILARMQVREFARGVGLDTKDQACISLAASSLAYALDLGSMNHGQITMDCMNDGECLGVRVVCTKMNGTLDDFTPEKLGNARMMVHQLTIEEVAPDGLQITAIRWNDRVHRSMIAASTVG